MRYFGSAAFHPHTDGGFSELRAVRAHQLRRLPDGVSTERGALAEPLAVAMHAVNRAGDVRGRDVVVNGAGPIGCLVVAAAKLAGAASVTAADLSAGSLAVAKELGADRVLDLGAGDRLPDDCELVFEASGARRPSAACCGPPPAAGPSSRSATCPAPPRPPPSATSSPARSPGSGAYRFVEEISDALDALADGLDVSGVITHRFGIDQAGEALAAAAGPGSSKVLIRLSGD